MIVRRVAPASYCRPYRTADEQRRYARRLLLTGWNAAAAAELSRLPVDQVLEIAAATDNEIPSSES